MCGDGRGLWTWWCVELVMCGGGRGVVVCGRGVWKWCVHGGAGVYCVALEVCGSGTWKLLEGFLEYQMSVL